MNLQSTLAPLAFVLVACTPEPPPVAPPPAVPTATTAPPPAEPVPLLRLPTDVHPTAESLELRVDPAADRFSGVVDIAVTARPPRAVVWLHGKGLHVTRATADARRGAPSRAATWEQRARERGRVDHLPAGRPGGQGEAPLRVRRPVRADSPEGLYKTTRGGRPLRVHAVRGHRRAHRVPLLRRARHSRSRSTDALVVPAGDAGDREHARDSRARTEGGWTRASASRRPSRSRATSWPSPWARSTSCPPPTSRRTPSRERPLPLRGVTPKGRGQGDRLRARAHGRDPRRVLEAVLRHRLPVRQARHPRRAGQGRRDGERGRGHVRRAARPHRREDGARPPAARLRAA